LGGSAPRRKFTIGITSLDIPVDPDIGRAVFFGSGGVVGIVRRRSPHSHGRQKNIKLILVADGIAVKLGIARISTPLLPCDQKGQGSIFIAIGRPSRPRSMRPRNHTRSDAGIPRITRRLDDPFFVTYDTGDKGMRMYPKSVEGILVGHKGRHQQGITITFGASGFADEKKTIRQSGRLPNRICCNRHIRRRHDLQPAHGFHISLNHLHFHFGVRHTVRIVESERSALRIFQELGKRPLWGLRHHSTLIDVGGRHGKSGIYKPGKQEPQAEDDQENF
jgi:hypothetical protein